MHRVIRLSLAVALLTLASTAVGQTTTPSSAPPFQYFGGLTVDPRVPTPRDVLGYDVGERFTRQADLIRYLRAVDEASDRVTMQEYGRTHQQRPLVVLTITSPSNHARLDEILERNRELADPYFSDAARIEDTLTTNPAIIYYSYNVHGNEASCTEAAIQVAYTLAAGTNPELRRMLDDTVVVIDPLLNPDGRERYVNWYQTMRGRAANPNPDAIEHSEPWPGGRTNHYYFDLNRDWLWLVQPESRQRLPVYRRFLPQLHIDHHEQGYTQPFFFGAGDEPYNLHIPATTKTWIAKYGAANAESFDGRGLVYATKERFDYLYPGYGKVLPVYHGAVGMLAEKGGHSRAGLAIKVSDQYTLSLQERADHHFLLGMSNLEFTATNRRAQLERFRQFFIDGAEGADGELCQVVIAPDNDRALLDRVWSLCDAHGIRIDILDRERSDVALYSYRNGTEETVTVPAGSWIIDTHQAMGHLARAVFERDTMVTEPETYDITAWSLPVLYGLHAWYSIEHIDLDPRPLSTWAAASPASSGQGNVAFIVDARASQFPVAIGRAMEHELFARIAGEDFSVDGRTFGAGSLIVHIERNPDRDLDTFVKEVVEAGLDVHRTARGITDDGPVLGANANDRLDLPKILLLRDEITSPNSYGQHWHMLDVASSIPHTAVSASALGTIDLDEYNTLVLPESSRLSSGLGDATTERLRRWVREGGVIVATGGSARWAASSILQIDKDGKDKSEATEDEDEEPPASELTYEERRERSIARRVGGALIRVTIDTSHPLATGMPEWIGTLKRSRGALPVKDEGYVVARFDADGRIGGLISDKNLADIAGKPFMTHHPMGRGAVIGFSDDVTFRGFSPIGQRLLLNAILFGATM